MPEITVIHIALIAAALLAGVIVGWIFRGSRSVGEKTAISLGWQEQLEAQRSEHERLLDQNKSLMEQNSQYQASNKDSKMRASELSDALKDAFERRDELQRQIKDIRNNLESTVVERDQLQNDMQTRGVEDDGEGENDLRSAPLVARGARVGQEVDLEHGPGLLRRLATSRAPRSGIGCSAGRAGRCSA